MFRLLGGGVPGDLVGLPRSQLALLPGTSHEGVLDRVDWLSSMILAFRGVDDRGLRRCQAASAFPPSGTADDRKRSDSGSIPEPRVKAEAAPLRS